MDFPPRPSLAVPVILITLYLIYAAIAQKKSHRPALPIVSARPGEWFPHLRAKWRNTIDFKTGITAAYSAYSKKDEACLLPLFGNDDFVLLPASNASFIIEQSEQVLSASKPHIEDLQTDRTLPDPSLVRNPTHHHVINRDLTSKVGNLVPDIIDEVERDLSEQWGTDTENWKEIVTYESVIKCIARTSNRVFIGAPLCMCPPSPKDCMLTWSRSKPRTVRRRRCFRSKCTAWIILDPLVPQATLPNRGSFHPHPQQTRH